MKSLINTFCSTWINVLDQMHKSIQKLKENATRILRKTLMIFETLEETTDKFILPVGCILLLGILLIVALM